MPAGGCFCNKVRISFTGEPGSRLLCHCIDCKKISGGSFSDNIVVPGENFKLESGTPKSISKTADTGKMINSFFCGDCGTTLYRTGESFGDAVIIKAGVLDNWEWVNENPPKGELFAPKRSNWIPQVVDAAQMQAMS